MHLTRTALPSSLTALVVALTGCTSSPAPPAPDYESMVFAARAPFLGDSSRVAALVSEVGPAGLGDFTLSLQTARPPLGLTVELRRPDKPFADTDFSEPATLLLGLVGNADRVTFTDGTDTYTLTAAAASAAAGIDVKRFGQDRQTLADYLATTDD